MKYAPHAVYLMKNLWSDSNYKIGFSNRPGRRRAEVDHQYKVEPLLLSCCWFPTEKAARAAENIWHNYCGDYRSDDHQGREWFSLPIHLVNQFQDWCLLSPDHMELAKGLFNGSISTKQVKALNDLLFGSIPRHPSPHSIDVWVSENYK